MAKRADVLGRLFGAPARRLLPQNRWLRLLLIAVPIVLVLAFLQPLVSLLAQGLELLATAFVPLLDDPLGRLLLLNALLAILLAIAWQPLRRRLHALRSGLVLRRHLAGVQALLDGDVSRARDLLRRVARARATAPPEFPAAAEDAKLKLARMALAEGTADEALAWLERVRQKRLPPELRRSLVQLRVRAAHVQGEVLPDTLESDARNALADFPDDAGLARELRAFLLTRGERVEAAELQARIVDIVPPRQRASARQQLAEDWLAAGEAALAAGDLAAAMERVGRAEQVATLPEVSLLRGRIRLAEGNVKAALRAFGQSRSPEGLAMMAELLDRSPDAVTPRELLDCSPYEGTLLLVARQLARAGDAVHAARAARRAARTLGPTPTVTMILAEALVRAGHHDEARQLGDDAVRRLVVADVDRP